MVSMSFRISDEIFDRLKKLADATGRTKTFYIQEAVNEQLTDIEDYYIAEKAWQEFQDGDKKTYTTTEIREEFGL